MNTKQLDKLLNNPGPCILSRALTQARLKRAGVTISKDLVKEGFCFPNYPVYPKYIRDFVEDQMRLSDLQNKKQ